MTKTIKRKAPLDHAKEFSLGYQKKGNDGNMWEIVKTKKGVKRWKKVMSDKSKTLKSKSQIENHNIILKTNINNFLYSPNDKRKVKKYVKEIIEEMGSADTKSIAFYLFVKSIKFENDNNIVLNINIKYDFNGKKIRPKPKGKLTDEEIVKLCSFENLKKHIKWSLNEASFRAEPLKLGANTEFSISEKQIKSIKLNSAKVKAKTKTRKKQGIFGKKSKTNDSNRLNKNNEKYKEIKKKMKGYKSYMTHFNSGRPYLVYIKNNDVHIYKESKKFNIKDDDYNNNDKKNRWMYIDFVKKYKAKKVFVGFDSCKFDGSDIGAYGKKWSMGNTILLQMSKNKYIIIDSTVREFTTKDEIIRFFAQIGRNDVPYPVAISQDNVYLLGGDVYSYIPRNLFPKMKVAEFENAYSYFYGNKDEEYDNISKKLKSKNLKMKVINKTY